MPPLITDKLPEVIALCERYGVRRLEVFGSASGNAETPFDPEHSDIDLLIVEEAPDAAERRGPLAPAAFMRAMEELFGRRVDVVYDKGITNPYFRRVVDDEREVLHDASLHEKPDADAAAADVAGGETSDESR